MKNNREACVAGVFYPRNKMELKKELTEAFNKVTNQKNYNDILGIISPHAGYSYSAGCAAHGYQALASKKIKTVVIIAPSHKFSGFDFSVGNYDQYVTPLGEILVNKEYVEMLLGYDKIKFYPEVHEVEHSLEVQLPLLQYLGKDCDLVPILLGAQTNENSKYLANILKDLFEDKLDEVAFIISSDLSHYHSVEKAKELDGLLMKYVKNLEIEKLEESYFQHQVEACGMGGILTMMHLAEQLGYNKVDNIKYAHSGEVSNDNSLVVGYLSTIFYK